MEHNESIRISLKIGNATGSKMAVVAEKELVSGEYIIQHWSPIFLNKLLKDNYFKNGQTDVSILKVWQDCCSYYYMPRILNQSVFEMTVTGGVTKGDYFGYADGKDGDKYLGFKFGEQVFSIGVDEAALLIECETAAKYKAEHAKGQEASGGATGAGAANGTGTSSQGNGNGGSSSGGASGGSSQGGGSRRSSTRAFSEPPI